MKFKKKTKISSEIPTSSMPDIIFMLLVFFMVTTVLKGIFRSTSKPSQGETN